MTGSAWNSFLPPQKCPTSLMGTVTPGDSLFLTLMCTTWYLLLSSLHFTYTCAYTQGKGLEHGYSYTVKSVSSDYQYTVHMLASQCSYGNECIPHCTQGKCSYLCRHMISCTCYDFSHGHLCKHVHKVQSVHRDQIGLEADTGTGSDDTEPSGRLLNTAFTNHPF